MHVTTVYTPILMIRTVYAQYHVHDNLYIFLYCSVNTVCVD